MYLNLTFHLSHKYFFFFNPYWSNNFARLVTKVCLVVFISLNNPIIICLSYYSKPTKIITRAKISCVLLNIHKSKLLVLHIFSPNFGKTCICFVFSTNLSNISLECCFLEGKITWGHRCKTKCLNQTLSTNYKGSWFFTIKRFKSCKKYFCCSSSF